RPPVRQPPSGSRMSPIHDQSYRRYGGTKATPGSAWTVIAGAGIRSFIRRRAFLGILLFALFPFIIRAVQIYFAANVAQAAMLAAGPENFRQFLGQQGFFVFVITVYVGAGLIANDRRANALQIYLSKPLMRSQDILCKLPGLFSFLVVITLIPALLLLMLKVMFDGSFTFLSHNLFLIPAITIGALIQVLL